MPSDGTIGGLVGKLDVLRVECPTCGRQGRYHVARLLEPGPFVAGRTHQRASYGRAEGIAPRHWRRANLRLRKARQHPLSGPGFTAGAYF
jgi:hypothetical protein